MGRKVMPGMRRPYALTLLPLVFVIAEKIQALSATYRIDNSPVQHAAYRIDTVLRVVSGHNLGLDPQRPQRLKTRHAGNQFTLTGIVRQIMVSKSDLVLEFKFIDLVDVMTQRRTGAFVIADKPIFPPYYLDKPNCGGIPNAQIPSGVNINTGFDPDLSDAAFAFKVAKRIGVHGTQDRAIKVHEELLAEKS